MYIIWNWTIIQGTTLEMIMKNDPLYQVLEIPMSDWKKLVQTTSYITIFDIFLRCLPRGRFASWGQLEVINYYTRYIRRGWRKCDFFFLHQTLI